MMRLVVLSNASFASAHDLTSQSGFVILMADESDCSNIVYYASSRCCCVSRSVMAAEVHALVHAVDMGMVAREALSELLHQHVEMEAYVDCRTLVNVATSKGTQLSVDYKLTYFLRRKVMKKGS